MAEKIIKNPSITSGDFSFSGDAITAIVGHPIAGAGGGGTQSDYVYVPSFDDQTGDITFTLGTTASEGKGPWHISGAQGPQGPSGTNGKDGKDGTNGENGISPTFTIAPTAGGTHVTISGAQGEESFDVLSGAKGADGQNGQNGAPGADGISPTFTTSVTSDEQHPQGGTHVVISGAAGENAFNVWNGVDGEGATVNLFGNNGVSVSKDGTNYTVGLSGGYYSDTLSAYSAMYAGYASNAKFGDNSVSSMDQLKGSIDDGNRVAYETSASLFTASAKWDEVSAKSRTTINSDQVVTTENNGTSATVSAVQYVTNDSFGTAPKQLFVCQDDNDLTAHLNICNGKGTLFFVCSAI